jgi:hypothetical protein
MNVIIKNDIEKYTPGHSSYGDSHPYMDFKKGEKFEVVIINYPGNPLRQPEGRFSTYSNCDSWVFQSVSYHSEFFADEIDALILTPQERESLTLWVRGKEGRSALILTPQERESLADALFNSAPFEVIVREDVQGTIVKIHSKKLGTINPNES